MSVLRADTTLALHALSRALRHRFLHLLFSSPPIGRPAAFGLLVLSGGAWAVLVYQQVLAPFDPLSLSELCMGLGSSLFSSPQLLRLASQQWYADGLLMVLAMMLPGAVRASTVGRPSSVGFAAVCDLAAKGTGYWPRLASWLAAYLALWCAALGAALWLILALGALAAQGWPASALSAGLVPQALAVCAAAWHGRLWWASSKPRAAQHHAPPQSALAAWRAGLREGLCCVRQCALPMLALHAIYGMGLAATAAYALWFWWRASSASCWPHAAAALFFLGSAARV